MLKPVSRSRLAAVSFIIAAFACGDDDPSGPSNELTLEQIVAQCFVGTIGDATGGVQQTGRLDAADCIPEITQGGGRIEGWRLPQSSFGGLTELEINVDADFDAIIVILGGDGTFLAESDTDIGGDLGRERYVLAKDLDPSLPQYFVGVFAIPNEPAGDYTIDIGPP